MAAVAARSLTTMRSVMLGALGTAPSDMDAGVGGDEAGSRCRESSRRPPGKHRICLAAAPVDERLGNGDASDRET